MLLIVGCRGNMGQRYQAVCNDLGVPFRGVDVENKVNFDMVTHVLIATPTDTHHEVYKFIRRNYTGPILCEKPFSRNENQLYPIIADDQLFIVDNYVSAAALSKPDYVRTETDETVYHYFNSGNDNLHLDCIQMYYMANGDVTLSNTSSVWFCIINGQRIDRSSIDVSYAEMLKGFMEGTHPRTYNPRKYYEAHLKALKAINDDEVNSGRFNYN